MESMWALIILAAAIFLITVVVRSAKRRLEVYRGVRSQLGFVEIKNSDESLLGRVAAIAGSEVKRVTVRRLYKREEGRHTLYNCHISQNNKSDGQGESFVLVMRDVDLPAFRMAPSLLSSTKFGGLMRRMTQLAMKQGGFEQVDAADFSGFAERYVLAARSAQQLKIKVPPEIFKELAGVSNHLFIKAQGDTVIFSIIDFASRSQNKDYETEETVRLRQAIDVASRLAGIFSREHQSASHAAWR